MPEDTPDQVRQKFYYGERRFEELAEKKRFERLTGAGIFIVPAVANLILSDEPMKTRLNVFIPSVIPSLFLLWDRSDEERRYETYRRAKEDFITHSVGPGIRFGLAFTPTGGILGTVQVVF